MPFNQQESTGRRDKGKFEVVVREGKTAQGHKSSRSRDRANSPAKAADVKKVVRRVREQEAEEIAEIDAEIRKLSEELQEARDRREAVVRKAWTKANVVRVTEMEEMAEEFEREIQRAAVARREEEA